MDEGRWIAVNIAKSSKIPRDAIGYGRSKVSRWSY